MAIGRKDWAPKPAGIPNRVVRFTASLVAESVETHVIEGVPVEVTGVARTVADCFRHRSKVGLSIAIEGLQEALRQRKATPAEIARQADRGGVTTVIRPYLEALTANAQRDQEHGRLGTRAPASSFAGKRPELRSGAHASHARTP